MQSNKTRPMNSCLASAHKLYCKIWIMFLYVLIYPLEMRRLFENLSWKISPKDMESWERLRKLRSMQPSGAQDLFQRKTFPSPVCQLSLKRRNSFHCSISNHEIWAWLWDYNLIWLTTRQTYKALRIEWKSPMDVFLIKKQSNIPK